MTTETRYAEVIEYADTEWQFSDEVLGVEDNICSRCSILEKVVEVSFGFNLPVGAIVDMIELDIKGGVTIFTESIYIWVWEPDTGWSGFKKINNEIGFPFCASTVFLGWRELNIYYFTRDRVNALKVRLQHDRRTGGGGGGGWLELWTSYVDAVRMRVTWHMGAVTLKKRMLIGIGL